MVSQGWREQAVEPERLYDLIFDSHETHNLTGDERYRDVLQDMRRRLDRWMEETADALLKGSVFMPQEPTVVNDPDDLSGRCATYSARDFLGI